MTVTLGTFLQSARNERGLTLRQLSDLLPSKPSVSFLSRLESGKISAAPDVLAEIAQALGLDAAEVLRHAKRDQTERSLMQDAYLLKLPFREEDRVGSAAGAYGDIGEACQRIGEEMYVAFRYQDMLQAFKSAEQIFARLGRTDALPLAYYRLGQSYMTLGLEAVTKGVDNTVSVDYFFEAVRNFELVYQDHIISHKRYRGMDPDFDEESDKADVILLLTGKSLALSALAHLNIWKASQNSRDQLYFREAVRLARRSEELYQRVISRLEAQATPSDVEKRLLADAYHKRAFLAQHIETETRPREEWQFNEAKTYFLMAIRTQKTIAAKSDVDIKHLARMHKDLGIALGLITGEDTYVQTLWQHTLAQQLHRDFDPARNPDARKRLIALDEGRDEKFCLVQRDNITNQLAICDFDALDYPEVYPNPTPIQGVPS